MKKVSFKQPLEERQCVLELELKDKIFIIKCASATVGATKEDSSIYDLFKSIIRYNDNIEEIMNSIDNELDTNQLIDLIVIINEELSLKKKSTNS